MVFLWSLSDSKSPQVFRTLLSILNNLNNAVVWLGLPSSSYFQILQSLYQSFGDCTKSTNYNWYHRNFHVPQFFQFPGNSVFFQFLICGLAGQQSPRFSKFSFSCWLSLSLVIWLRVNDPFESQRSLCISFSRTDFRLCILLLLLSLLFYCLRVLHTSVRWWYFTGVTQTASLCKFPGLFSVFWPILVL